MIQNFKTNFLLSTAITQRKSTVEKAERTSGGRKRRTGRPASARPSLSSRGGGNQLRHPVGTVGTEASPPGGVTPARERQRGSASAEPAASRECKYRSNLLENPL